MTNLIIEKEITRILSLYYPSLLDIPGLNLEGHIGGMQQAGKYSKVKLTQQQNLSKIERLPGHETGHELDYVFKWLSLHDISHLDVKIQRWGRAKLTNGQALSSRLADSTSKAERYYRWFEVSFFLRCTYYD
jgi:hypothetical protein